MVGSRRILQVELEGDRKYLRAEESGNEKPVPFIEAETTRVPIRRGRGTGAGL